MERDATWLMGKPGDEDWMLGMESDTAAYGGQFNKARELTRRAVESALRADEKEGAAGHMATAAMRGAGRQHGSSKTAGTGGDNTLEGKGCRSLLGVCAGAGRRHGPRNAPN
jgi:hypothetical protein